MQNTTQFIEQRTLLHTNTNNKNMQYGNSLWEASISSINPYPIDVFWPCNCWGGVGVKLTPSWFFAGRKLLLTDLKPGIHTE